MKGGVYRITNLLNGKSYVGSSVDVKYRISRHRHELRKGIHINKHLQSAWNKYGESCFEFCILLYCEPNELLIHEQQQMTKYQVIEYGYNICKTAGNCLGIIRSEETREKMKGNTNGKGRKGHIHSKEAKVKMSNAKIGKPSGMKGKKHSVESREKMAAAKRGKPSNRSLSKFNNHKGGKYGK